MTATTRFNKFGATASDVVAMYPGTILADYDGGGTAGEAIIEGVLDRIAREVASAMSPEVYKQITEVDCQEVVKYATANQTSFTLGIAPIVAGSVHLWIYPPIASLELRQYGLNDYSGSMCSDEYFRKPVLGYGEVATTDYSVAASTGVVSYTGPALGTGCRVYASYNTDITADTFALPSVSDIVLLGAASELGARLFSEGTQEWKLVDEYRSRYRGAFDASDSGVMKRALSGEWLPDELRALTYFVELDRKSEQVSSVRTYRG